MIHRPIFTGDAVRYRGEVARVLYVEWPDSPSPMCLVRVGNVLHCAPRSMLVRIAEEVTR